MFPCRSYADTSGITDWFLGQYLIEPSTTAKTNVMTFRRLDGAVPEYSNFKANSQYLMAIYSIEKSLPFGDAADALHLAR